MTKEEKLARKQQRKAEKVGLGKLLLWNSSSCSVALSTLMLGYATFYCTDVLQLAPALVGTLFMVCTTGTAKTRKKRTRLRASGTGAFVITHLQICITGRIEVCLSRP